jgi:hypothetical protein
VARRAACDDGLARDDAFPGNAKIWETQEKAKHPGESPEASEHINALFGEGS